MLPRYCRGVAALTPELLYSRTYAELERIDTSAKALGWRDPDDQEILLQRIVCDRCGTIVDLLVEPFPIGWTTVGDLEHGFTDLCRGCSS